MKKLLALVAVVILLGVGCSKEIITGASTSDPQYWKLVNNVLTPKSSSWSVSGGTSSSTVFTSVSSTNFYVSSNLNSTGNTTLATTTITDLTVPGAFTATTLNLSSTNVTSTNLFISSTASIATGNGNVPLLSGKQMAAKLAGVLSFSSDPRDSGGLSSQTASGTAYYIAHDLLVKGQVVSQGCFNVITIGAGATSTYVGLYNRFGTQLAISVNTTSAFTVTGWRCVDFSSTLTVTSTDSYFLGVVNNAATQPFLERLNTQPSLTTANLGGTNLVSTQASQTLPATASFAGASNLRAWLSAIK